MSETIIIAAILSISGGLQDAYSYLLRGEVFANAQTGNIVLMSVNFIKGNFHESFRYLAPLSAFAFGIFIAEAVHRKYKDTERLHWRQMVLVAEILLLIAAAFIPENFNEAANSLVSFTCAMQVQTFRKFRGKAYASTMCIGNLRSCMDALCTFVHTHDKEMFFRGCEYLFVIFMFACGCALGGVVTAKFGLHSILFSSGILAIACILMFIRANEIK